MPSTKKELSSRTSVLCNAWRGYQPLPQLMEKNETQKAHKTCQVAAELRFTFKQLALRPGFLSG